MTPQQERIWLDEDWAKMERDQRINHALELLTTVILTAAGLIWLLG